MKWLVALTSYKAQWGLAPLRPRTYASVGLVVIPYESNADTCYAVEWFQLFDCETDYGNDAHEHLLYQ